MGKKVIIMALALCVILLLGGCSNMGNSKEENHDLNEDNEDMNKYEKENFVRVQEYTGEGFTLRDANPKTGEIAEANQEDVVQAVEDFFLSEYKTEVIVQNIVSAVDGVSVFVESSEEPHFYSFAIIPVDIKNKEVKTDQVWSQEGQVENAIQGALYAMAYKDEFDKLDDYLEEITEEFPVVGTPPQVVESVMGTGFSTAYYFTSPLGDMFDDLYDAYLKNPEITKPELTHFFSENRFGPEDVIVTINMYMEEAGVEPDETVLNDIVTYIEEFEGVPRGSYSFLLHDNLIDKRRADGMKENTLKRTTPNKITKE